jgi:hypothetical protein
MSKPQHPREPAFQLTWALLHLAGAAMNFGSFLYHMRRVLPAKKKGPPVDDPSLYADYWYKT